MDTAQQSTNAEIADALSAVSRKIQTYKNTYGEWPRALFDGRSPLPANAQLAGCIVLRDRVDIIRAMPKARRFAEIGTLYGDFAVKILEIAEPSELHIFDLSFHLMRPDNRNILDAEGTVYHQGCSWDEMAKLPEDYFDVVYVDADHSHASVSKDLEQALRITRSGGAIIANDYTGWSWPQCKPYGVFPAVNAFAINHGLPFTHLALQINGYYDVALRKP